MKIVYCLNAICYGGGTERVTIAKANALAEIEGNEVWILVTDNKYAPALPISEKVHLVDLGIEYYVNQSKNPIIDLLKESVKRHRHKLLLQKTLEDIGPDIVISVNQGEKYILPRLRLSSNPVVIRELHYYKYYRRDFADSLVKRLLARLADWYDFGWKIWKYDAIVTLTETDRQLYWNGDERVRVMPNPLIEKPARRSDCNNKIVMAVGRLKAQKNFRALLRVWQKVEARHADWKLQIWGEGSEREQLEEDIRLLQLKNATLQGFSPDLIEHYADASLLAVSSMYEGFPLMIIEAMSAGLPVVSCDCPCGPRDIICDGADGFLVGQDDVDALAEKICFLIENEDVRKKMGGRAKVKSENYKIGDIALRWMRLFEELKPQKA